MRAIGIGEVAILRGIWDIAQNPKVPSAVRLRAWEALASYIGLKEDIIEPMQAVQIIINTSPSAQAAAGKGGPGSVGPPPFPPKPMEDDKPRLPRKPLQITR